MRPMETAPQDKEVLLWVKRAGLKGWVVGHYMPGGHCIEDHPPIDKGWYRWDGHGFARMPDPEGWMPLPGATVRKDLTHLNQFTVMQEVQAALRLGAPCQVVVHHGNGTAVEYTGRPIGRLGAGPVDRVVIEPKESS